MQTRVVDSEENKVAEEKHYGNGGTNSNGARMHSLPNSNPEGDGEGEGDGEVLVNEDKSNEEQRRATN